MRLLATVLALWAAMTGAAACGPLRLQDRNSLEDTGRRPVVASIHLSAGTADELQSLLSPSQFVRLDEIAMLIVRARADLILGLAESPLVRQIEIIDDEIADRVVGILSAVHSISLKQGTMYQVGALNISLGVSKARLNANRSGEHTVRRAIEHLINRHEIPVTLSLGNDGPAPGLVNPWALAEGAIAAAAVDVEGKELWSGSSRFPPGGLANHNVFAAHGYLSVGAWAGTPKTPDMIAAEKKVDLTKLVGAGNEHLYRVDSGTSYAAAEITRAICQIHQAISLLRLQMSATSSLEVVLPQFVRAYIDTGVAADHPMFRHRLADRSPMNGGLRISFTAQRRQALHKVILGGAALDVRYNPKIVLQLLKRAAAAVPNTTPDETGYGFISRHRVSEALAQLSFVDLVSLFSSLTGSQLDGALKRAASIQGPLFLPSEISSVREYCDDYDLILMHRVS